MDLCKAMSDNIQDAIKDIIEGGADVPDRVTNRLLLAAIIHNSDQTEITNARAEETNTLIREQNSRISKLELQATDYPSMVQLIKDNPAGALRFSMFILFVLFILHTLESQLMPYVFALLKMATP